MGTSDIDSNKLNEALDKFGSLQKANEGLEKENQTLEKRNAQLRQANAQLAQNRDNMLAEVKLLEEKLTRQKDQLLLRSKWIEQNDRQYHLFESFIAMMVGSPSLTSSTGAIKALFQELSDSRWQTSHNPENLRSLFVSTVMGDYLKCFRCDFCGASFIVNKEPHAKDVRNYYKCPACHLSPTVRPDDTFLKAMVSEKQLEGIRRSVEIQKENDSLKPFKIFFNIRCEVCEEPVTEWTDRNIKKGISGLGWGHTQCWDSPLGTAKQMAKLFTKQLGS